MGAVLFRRRPGASALGRGRTADMSDWKSELKNANGMRWTREEQRAEMAWRLREETKQRQAETETMIEAKVSHAFCRMR